jgi:hypothetical protein
MDSSRRKFIGILSASVAAFLSLRGTASAQRKSSRILTDASTDPLSELGWSSFYRQLDTDFEFSPRGAKRAKRPSKLRLTAMKNTDLRQEETQAGDPQCFVLNFTSLSAKLGQDTYTVNHTVLGQFELFISEASFTEGEYCYTAVVNRVVG